MSRYKLTLEYDGTNFAGWQIQPNQRTVQGVLTTRLGWLLAEEPSITGAGRTDAGVHALGQVVHFDAPAITDRAEFLQRLNAALPDDVCGLGLQEAPGDFHARYSAIRKIYHYHLTLGPSAFAKGRSWRLPGPIDWGDVETATAKLVGNNDYAGFCLAGSQKEDNHCQVEIAHWRRAEREAVFEITANRFLHRMVRLVVGTLVDIGRGRWRPAQIDEILESGDVRLAGQAAPPEGLYLVRVEYP